LPERSASSSSSCSRSSSASRRVLEVAGESADDHVRDQTGDTGDQDRLRLVGVRAAVLVGVGREGERGDQQDDQRDADRQHVDLAELGQRALDPAQPLDVPLLEDEVEEIISRNMPPKAAIAGWASVPAAGSGPCC